MSHDTLTITGTRAYLGVRLQRIAFGLVSYLASGAIMVFLLWRASLTQDLRPAAVVFFLLIFGTHILRCFIREELGNDESRPLPPDQVDSLLSFALVEALHGKGVITAGDLMEAAARTQRGRFLLQEMGINPADFVARCRGEVEESIELLTFLQYALRMLPALQERVIDANVVLQLLFQHVPACQKLLNDADLSVDDLPGIVQWEGFHHRFRLAPSGLSPEALSGAVVGRSWVSGYTGALDMLTTELSAQPQAYGEKSVVIHRNSIESILTVLARSTLRNVLVLGKTGVGKRTLMRNVACAMRDREQQSNVPYTRVLVLKTQLLLSGIQKPDTVLLDAFTRAEHSGHFLIIIEDLPLFLKSASEQLKGVLLKFLQAKSIALVGIADIQDYHTLIKTDAALDSMFEKVTVDDASEEESMTVLMAHSFVAAAKEKVIITYKAMRAILELTQRYLSGRGGLPGKVLEVFDDVVVKVRQSGQRTVSEDDVRAVISQRSRVNVQKVTDTERDRLLTLEEVMRRSVIGQDAAIKSVVSALKRARLDIAERKRPIGTFLFLGPTGVGKTQTAKVLAKEYYGSADAIARLDMNEFSHEDSLFGIIGSPGGTGGDKDGFLARRVQDNPFTLILLDEIEKAHPKVLNLFLQILDEGVFNDARGIKTDFRNCIIIATSNAGALFIRDYVKQHPEMKISDFKTALVDQILRDRIFTPEFINRFDDTVLFTPLSTADATKVGALMIGDIVADVEKKRGIKVVVGDDVLQLLVARGYSSEFGAREMRRTIGDVIEDYLADLFLRQNIKRGEIITIRPEDVQR